MIHSHCNFHCLSHFAAAFIAVGTKTSIVKIYTIFKSYNNNDPSAGSPTETLLRLLLPLKDRIYGPSKKIKIKFLFSCPNNSSYLSIGRSDGRCVQRAGT
ncbi:hypothetical protein [Plasmodium yoelii yoelii]|uniref:Uncharacterized protein n=1 Tax=Plasmodium yoelii yoelii TaxID=73239 RepID=Q7RFP9_PLAYO|nr:hypothetical protein [Plasmodium yoelii yoelii]